MNRKGNFNDQSSPITQITKFALFPLIQIETNQTKLPFDSSYPLQPTGFLYFFFKATIDIIYVCHVTRRLLSFLCSITLVDYIIECCLNNEHKIFLTLLLFSINRNNELQKLKRFLQWPGLSSVLDGIILSVVVLFLISKIRQCSH